MFLVELFDKALPWQWVQSPKQVVIKSADFYTPKEQHMVVDFIYKRQPDEARDPNKVNRVEVEFCSKDKSGWCETDITGKGEELPIFSTVLEIVDAFLTEFPHVELTFTASTSEPSRMALYDRLVKRMAPNATSRPPAYGEKRYDIPAREPRQ